MTSTASPVQAMDTEARFPPLTRQHIIHCSYDQWFPKYRASCIKSRIIPLTPDFVEYLREDMVVLADDDELPRGEDADDEWSAAANTRVSVQEVTDDDGDDGDGDSSDSEAPLPPNHRFPALHQQIRETIRELGGKVFPKTNWSAPQDAAWISPYQNTLACQTPNDIYLLLKSSSFTSHDLDYAIDRVPESSFQHVLVLKPFFQPHPAMEFRCFVKARRLVGVCQRDLNYYPFLADLRDGLRAKVAAFFEEQLRDTFPDPCFVFDVYVPADETARDGLGRVKLMDISPYGETTDSILFDWSEILLAPVPEDGPGDAADRGDDADGGDGTDEVLEWDLRLVEKDDPSAYNFSASKFSAHKLPKEVVDASSAGQGGLRDFLQQWKTLTGGPGDMWTQ